MDKKNDLIPGQKTAQTSTQEAKFSSPISTQFPGSDSSQENSNKIIINNQYLWITKTVLLKST